MKRALVSIVAGVAILSASAAYAGSTPLAPAGAAGVKKAEGVDNRTIMMVGGGALAVAGLAVVLSNSGNGHAGSVSTCPAGQPATSCGGGSGGTGSTGTH